MVVVDGVDLVEVDEVLDVDRPGGLGVEGVELLGRDHHVGVRAQLVALDDVLVGDLLAGGGRDPLLLHPRLALGVDLVEADVLGRHRAVELHRHVHQPEADGPGPHRSSHGYLLPIDRTVNRRPLAACLRAASSPRLFPRPRRRRRRRLPPFRRPRRPARRGRRPRRCRRRRSASRRPARRPGRSPPPRSTRLAAGRRAPGRRRRRFPPAAGRGGRTRPPPPSRAAADDTGSNTRPP